MRRSLATGLVAVACALAGCGGDDGGGESGGGGDYPPEVEENFVKSCSSQPQANEAFCKCTYERIKETVPYEDFKKAEESLSSSQDQAPKEVQDALTKAVEACRKELVRASRPRRRPSPAG